MFREEVMCVTVTGRIVWSSTVQIDVRLETSAYKFSKPQLVVSCSS